MEPCFECLDPTDGRHAVMPGSDRTVPLCAACLIRLRTGVGGGRGKPMAKPGWPLGRLRKLTPEQVARVRVLRAQGMIIREIARDVGCGVATVCRILNS